MLNRRGEHEGASLVVGETSLYLRRCRGKGGEGSRLRMVAWRDCVETFVMVCLPPIDRSR